MAQQVIYKDLGIIDYKEAWDYQEKEFSKIVNAKRDNIEHDAGMVILCEHPHVYTLGKSGEQNNLLINDQFLKSIHATYYKINRGGDITYHGPGQIVGYPILDLEKFDFLVREYIYRLEEVIIRTLSDYNIESSRLEGATGVWLDVGKKGLERKICAIGVRVSRWVSMHGFAFNINTDLEYFNHINPCGFVDKGVTSLQKELGREVDENEVKAKLKHYFAVIFEMEFLN